MKILKNFQIFEKMDIQKEIMREKKMKRRREGACSTSYPSGNQVDRLPPVLHTKTIRKRKSRRPRTQILLTMRIMFSNVIVSISALVNSWFNSSYPLRLARKKAKRQNDRAIS